MRNKHIGAEKLQAIKLDGLNGYIYGINESDGSKSESGKPHIHIETPKGESEYYFSYSPVVLIYKAGIKLSDKEYDSLFNEMCRYDKLIDDTFAFGAHDMWDCANQDNKKCILFNP